jgi:hypothetical protein
MKAAKDLAAIRHQAQAFDAIALRLALRVEQVEHRLGFHDVVPPYHGPGLVERNFQHLDLLDFVGQIDFPASRSWQAGPKGVHPGMPRLKEMTFGGWLHPLIHAA